ncbi:unnamed protein product [Cylicostephanus goldi]|uniref:C-type lectin domain-containing protein n=1 Tax=Cylicostephanus goldi TaxID=71465 RepID=A0A3P6QJ80_CYLGO|nr:unnamed protein product [Cylicostephanus goldi]
MKWFWFITLIVPVLAYPLESDGSGAPRLCPYSGEAAPAYPPCDYIPQEEVTEPPQECNTCAMEEPTIPPTPEPCSCCAVEQAEEPETTPAPESCCCTEPVPEPEPTPAPACACPPMEEETTVAPDMCECPQRRPVDADAAAAVDAVTAAATAVKNQRQPLPQPLRQRLPPPLPLRRQQRLRPALHVVAAAAEGDLAVAVDAVAVMGCADGWFRYQDSCYYMELTKMDAASAERACNEKGGSLFVADTLAEFNEVMKEAPLYFWSWIGLGQSEGDSYPKWHMQGTSPMKCERCLPPPMFVPIWDGIYGMDPSLL